MDSKQDIVAARSGLLERKSKVLALATLGAVALLGAIVASAAPPAQNGFDAEINRHAQAMMDEGEKDISLRHLWQRGVLGRHASTAQSDRRREERWHRSRRFTKDGFVSWS